MVLKLFYEMLSLRGQHFLGSLSNVGVPTKSYTANGRE